jgi:membrane protein implicated in regulation of membrane protease activity
VDSLPFDAWQLWVIAGVLFLIAEIIGTEFILLAIGSAFVATGLATEAFDLELNQQILVAGVSATAFVPIFVYSHRRFFKARGSPSLLSEGLGQEKDYEVTEYGGRLGIRIHGDFYPVETMDEEDAALRAGEKVRLKQMRGVTAYVQRQQVPIAPE